MSLHRIPWRDNGLLLGLLGLIIVVALIVTETVFQKLYYQDPVLRFVLQTDSDTDHEEDDDKRETFTDAETAQIKNLLAELFNKKDDEFDWQAFREKHAETSTNIWQEFAVGAAKGNYHLSVEQVFSGLLSEHPTAENLLFQYAKAAGYADNDSLAVQRYRALIKQHPNHQASYINLALTLARLDRHDEAVEVASQAIALSSGIRKAKAFSIRASSYQYNNYYIEPPADLKKSNIYQLIHVPN